MQKLGDFSIVLPSGLKRRLLGSQKRLRLELFVDKENTHVVLNCSCCPETLAHKLPSGVLIPIISSLRAFFNDLGMKNIDVSISGTTMRRIYNGVLNEIHLTLLQKFLQETAKQISKT